MAVKVLIYKAPKGGLIAESNPASPHIVVPHDRAEVYVSPEAAHRLVVSERAEYVRDAGADADIESYSREDDRGLAVPELELESFEGVESLEDALSELGKATK